MFANRPLSRLLTLLAIGAAVACGGKDATGPGSPAASEGTILLKNASNVEILVVNITPCSDPSWGPDRLGANETIAPGAQRTFKVARGCTDVRARTLAGDQEWFDLNVVAGATQQIEADSFAASVSSRRVAGGDFHL